ncbi:MAG TPA: CarD family transcriptional regulator, partial [Burkholderiaceae bacterium]
MPISDPIEAKQTERTRGPSTARGPETGRFELTLPESRAGERYAIARPPGSGDALLLARQASAARARGQLTLLVCADALDAQRLTEELPWFEPRLEVHALPDWETLPYDILSPHQDLVSERLETLYRLMSRGAPQPQAEIDVLVVAATTALARLTPPEFIAARTFYFRQGDTIDPDRLRAQMVMAGYQHVSQVVAPGEFSIRGGLIDLFPTGSAVPYRLDLLDALIETIRTFDPDTQRSLYPVPQVRLLPGREFPFDEAARGAFRGRWREQFEGDPSRAPLYRDVGNGIPAAGIEYYLPLFFERTATLADYLPAQAQVVLLGDVEAACRRFSNETAERFRFLARDTLRPCLPPEHLFLNAEQFFAGVKPFARLALTESGDPAAAEARSDADFAPLPALAIDRKAPDPLQQLRAWSAGFDGRVLLVADSAGRRETISQLLADARFEFADSADFDAFAAADARFALGIAPLHQGFSLPRARLAIVTEAELYAASPRRLRQRHRERASNVDAMVRDLAELRVGDPVVHVEHGIGRYLGLESLDLGGGPAEFLHLQYAHEAKLYVPVAQLHLIGRYSGADPAAAPLHTLGSGDWERARRKAARQVRDTAAELLNLYAA